MNEMEREREALEAYTALIAQAGNVRRLFEDAALPLPDRLSRFIGENQGSTNGSSKEPRIRVSPPTSPPRPPNAKDDWIAVPICDLTSTTLLLGILRENGGPMPSKERLKKLKEYQPDTNLGSSLNVGHRLEGELITKTPEGWRITDPAQAPVFYKGNAWGPLGIFQPPERTAVRRMLIVHLLKATGAPLQATPILKLLQESQLWKSPVNKDLLKLDLMALKEEGKIRGTGRPKKWIAITE